MEQQLATGSAYSEGWFDRDAVRRVNERHAQGRRDCSSVLWPLMTFGLWLDRVRGAHDA
jgi:hypothetical protein